MTKHKWHKEIKAWADGAEIEFYHSSYAKWVDAPYNPDWSGNITYRIKPQPKEPQYLYVYFTGLAELSLSTLDNLNQYELLGKIKMENDDGQ